MAMDFGFFLATGRLDRGVYPKNESIFHLPFYRRLIARSKGCYSGQEILERIRVQDKLPSHQMIGLAIDISQIPTDFWKSIEQNPVRIFEINAPKKEEDREEKAPVEEVFFGPLVDGYVSATMDKVILISKVARAKTKRKNISRIILRASSSQGETSKINLQNFEKGKDTKASRQLKLMESKIEDRNEKKQEKKQISEKEQIR